MKPKRHKGHGSGTLIANLQAPLSKATYLEIFQSLRSLLTNSSQVSLGLHLFTLSARFRTPLVRIRRSLLDMSKPPQLMLGKLLLNQCHPDPISNNFVPDSISSLCARKTSASLLHSVASHVAFLQVNIQHCITFSSESLSYRTYLLTFVAPSCHRGCPKLDTILTIQLKFYA